MLIKLIVYLCLKFIYMIRFSESYSLKLHNSFAVDAKAKYFFEFTELEDLEVFLNSNETWKEEKIIVIGEGSNVLFLSDFDGLVIRPNIPGMGIVKEDRQNVWVEVGAGEVWDEFVQFAVENRLGGVENLSLIPGSVGASPVQNIGAYGQEVCSVIEKVKGFDLEKNEAIEFSADKCMFAYRNSIFKSYLKNRFIITSVVFRMEKFPEYVLDYGVLKEKVNEKGEVNLQNVRNTVMEIRSAKLPDVNLIGSAGSFFKNPIVDVENAEKIEGEFKAMPVFLADEGKVKLAAGWLIDKAGWKGYREGDAGVHEKQALVIVNYGKATGTDIYNLSEKIKQSVFDKFGVELEREVNCV